MARDIQIPGGTATIISDQAELTERRRRPVKSIAAAFGGKLADIMQASIILNADGTPATGPDVAARRAAQVEALHLSPDDYDKVWEMQDATTWGYLLSWTLDRPLPATWRDVADLPADLYEALSQAVAENAAPDLANQFTVDAVEDETSPTGPSGV